MNTGFDIEINAAPDRATKGRSQATLLLEALTHYRDHQLAKLQEEFSAYVADRDKAPTELFDSIEQGYIRELFTDLETLHTLLDLLTDGLNALLLEWHSEMDRGD